MTRRLAREEGIFAGISSGGAMQVTLRVAKQLKNAVPGLTEAELLEMGFDPTVRPERLPPEAFVRLLRRSRQL